jgi:hypothetical protein
MSNTNIDTDINTNKQNISFLLEEKEDNTKDHIDMNNINNFIELFEDEPDYEVNSNEMNELQEMVYTMYTVKELLKICVYYEIDKNIKAAKCKKADIISSIVFFEAQPENMNIVYKRKTYWSYMDELMSDPKMKKYVVWS